MSTTIINPKTGRAVIILSDEERKAKQNAQYAAWRAKLELNPAKLADYKARKNAASKKCIAGKKELVAQLQAELDALKQNS